MLEFLLDSALLEVLLNQTVQKIQGSQIDIIRSLLIQLAALDLLNSFGDLFGCGHS